jgi:hypothetical protein
MDFRLPELDYLRKPLIGTGPVRRCEDIGGDAGVLAFADVCLRSGNSVLSAEAAGLQVAPGRPAQLFAEYILFNKLNIDSAAGFWFLSGTPDHGTWWRRAIS